MATFHTDSTCCVEHLGGVSGLWQSHSCPMRAWGEGRKWHGRRCCWISRQSPVWLISDPSLPLTPLRRMLGRAQKLINQFKLFGNFLAPENSRKYWIIKSRRGKDSWEKGEMNIYWTTPVLLDIFFSTSQSLSEVWPSFYREGRKRIQGAEEVSPNHWTCKSGFVLRSVFTAQNRYTFTVCTQLLFSARVRLSPYPLCVKDFFPLTFSNLHR